MPEPFLPRVVSSVPGLFGRSVRGTQVGIWNRVESRLHPARVAAGSRSGRFSPRQPSDSHVRRIDLCDLIDCAVALDNI